jgi:hypothetical protein
VSRRRRVGIAGVAACAAIAVGAGAARAQPLPPGVDGCLARIEQQRSDAADSGRGREPAVPRLGEICPELATAVDEGTWGQALPGISAADLTPAAFEALTRIAADYERPSSGQIDLSAAALDDALDELELREAPEQLSIWERIRRWYDEHFGAERDETRSWLERWLEGFSVTERAIRYLMIALGVLVVAATAAIVWNELRVAGVLAGGLVRKYSPFANATAESEPRPKDIDDVLRAPLLSRPALLLALVLDRLRAREQAPLRDSLTHRELLRAAKGLSAEQSDAFRVVVGAAERTTFGGWRPDEASAEALLERGRALIASLGPEARAQ